MVQLATDYQHRPLIAEELWAGQITRAVRLLGPLDDEAMYEQVVAITGLNEEQVMRAAAWRETHRHPFGPTPA
ncbi:hypothetical protein OG871_37965 [Kitasatospora sp. NBC_00374]|uniref:hypothetical protein n=1 Tax=Kitasatospora sp. NBC_00374 TaxID=2975964 RepID=UPI003247270B